MKLRLSGVIKESIVDGPGIRYVVFTQGCPHHCFNCHNPHTFDFKRGYLHSIAELVSDINQQPYLTGITLSGGEPFLQVDQCLELLTKINQQLDVIVYTGYLFEDLIVQANKNKNLMKLLNLIDYLVDGKFDYALIDLTLRYRGSSNQRIIEMKKSLQTFQVVSVEL
jgi:anaerobic ribonucleoside-triphosphate reductase activating protein